MLWRVSLQQQSFSERSWASELRTRGCSFSLLAVSMRSSESRLRRAVPAGLAVCAHASQSTPRWLSFRVRLEGSSTRRACSLQPGPGWGHLCWPARHNLCCSAIPALSNVWMPTEHRAALIRVVPAASQRVHADGQVDPQLVALLVLLQRMQLQQSTPGGSHVANIPIYYMIVSKDIRVCRRTRAVRVGARGRFESPSCVYICACTRQCVRVCGTIRICVRMSPAVIRAPCALLITMVGRHSLSTPNASNLTCRRCSHGTLLQALDPFACVCSCHLSSTSD
jgi:hypothetical protein